MIVEFAKVLSQLLFESLRRHSPGISPLLYILLLLFGNRWSPNESIDLFVDYVHQFKQQLVSLSEPNPVSEQPWEFGFDSC